MPAIPIALAVALLAACGSSRPADSSASTTEPLGEPADAGVSLGRPSQPGGDAGAPELPPTVIKSSVLEAQRLTGNPRIEPDLADRTQLAGKSAMVAIKLCVDGTGKVSTIKLLRSSGLPNYDQKVLREVKNWTYRPTVAEGQPVDLCTAMTLIYRPPASPPAR